MDKEQMELVVFEIVNSAGMAKGLAYEALGEAEREILKRRKIY